MIAHPIAHAHDHFVRTLMSDIRIAREFFVIHLPPDILKVTDLNRLEVQPRSFIDDIGKESIVDLLYKTFINGEEAFLYLLVEHQSTPDKLQPFRMLKYQCNMMDDYVKKNKKKKLPLIYPIVIYHGPRPYPYSTDIADLVDAPKELIDRYFLKPFHLIDLGRINDEELKQHQWVGIMEFVLKHIFARDLLPRIREIAKLLHNIVAQGGREFVFIVLNYVINSGKFDKAKFYNLINTEISKTLGDQIMTVAEELRAEGRENEKFEIAKRLLMDGIAMDYVANVTGIPLNKLATFFESK